MILGHVNVDSLPHPFSSVKPNVQVVLHSRQYGQDRLEHEEASEQRDVCFLVKQVVHGSVNYPEVRYLRSH
jgi:hypothetical protein